MPKKLKMKGWVTVDGKPPRAKTYAADLNSAPLATLKAKAAGADAVRPPRPVGKAKLRGVYVRPARGSDAQAKLVIVDATNKPKFAQG